MLPRSTTVEFDKIDQRETVTKMVRAASKPGAILTARVDAVRQIPLRSQDVTKVNSKGESRFLNQWEVEIQDRKDLKTIQTRNG